MLVADVQHQLPALGVQRQIGTEGLTDHLDGEPASGIPPSGEVGTELPGQVPRPRPG
ncbi:hypothetical protein ACIB24_09810 [Spongisporangium articulatum]|uniref:Uncharacterized protein n=1 Tax=Spongisporangium articulatum TaxID=3362603 RepID=A0ABW8ALX3_9ACTN